MKIQCRSYSIINNTRGQCALSSVCVLDTVHVCQSQCFGQGRVTYGNVLSVQRKVLTYALDSMRLFVHLSHPHRPSTLFSLSFLNPDHMSSLCMLYVCCLADYLMCG